MTALQNSDFSTSSQQSCKISNHKRDQALVLRNENAELRQSLLDLQEQQQELKHECNFYRVKVSELSEIVQVKDREDAYSEMAVAKSLQNAELTMEVDRLKQQLHKATCLNQKLSEQREHNKHMLLQLSGIVKALQSVPVEYDAIGVKGTKNNNVSLENVKAKVENIMEDRRMLVLRCQELEQANKDKDEKLVALEAQFHLLNSLNFARGDDAVSVEPLPSIARNSSNVSAASKSSITTAPSTSSSPARMDIDMNVIRSSKGMKPSTKQMAIDDNASFITESTKAPASLSETDSPILRSSTSVSTGSPGRKYEDPESEIQRLQAELAESNQRHEKYKTACQKGFDKMKDVESEFSHVKEEYKQATAKSDQLREHLKEVIDQYKQLHQEYDQVVDKLENAKYEIKYLEKTVRELESDREHVKEYGAEVLEQEGLADNVDKLMAAYLKARETIESLKEKVASAGREVEETEKRRNNGGRQYRDAVAQCRKLQHEIKVLEMRVANAEDETQLAKKETQKYKEEAKHTRRRMTQMMKKGGNPPPSTSAPSTPRNEIDALLLPDLITVPSNNERSTITEQHRLLLLEAAIAGKAMSEKQKLIQDRDQLLSENQELKGFCEEILSDVGILS